MWFEEAWTPFLGEAETVVYRPTLDVVFTLPDGSEAEHVFVVDSGASKILTEARKFIAPPI